MRDTNKKLIFIQLSIVAIIIFATMLYFYVSSHIGKQSDKYTSERCVNGYYEEYWTSKSTVINIKAKNQKMDLHKIRYRYLIGYKYTWNK